MTARGDWGYGCWRGGPGDNIRGGIPGAPGAPGGGIPKGGGGTWPGCPERTISLAFHICRGCGAPWYQEGCDLPGKPNGGGNAPGGTIAGLGTALPSAA